MTRKADCYTGCGIAALAVLAFLGASRFPETSSGLGAGGFPKFVAVCLGILGVIQAVKSYIELRRSNEPDRKVLKAEDLLGAGILVISFGLYIIAVKPLGYILSTTLFFFLFMYIYGERRYIWMAIISTCFSLIAYYLFTKVFYVMLPPGRLF